MTTVGGPQSPLGCGPYGLNRKTIDDKKVKKEKWHTST
jgi:hypothetical protein